ncbi:hypothetical protein [Duganella qianjiadongensis]|uniref:Uncharacterized protein n=1 Tax=Duganella qianjiadongensis TaxID=2692176 RepID=A0ABW9VQ88_9BURK|nr:hypothetical protein [Duganella qianjiadongensis]MYM40583.1 hypothetical protein [Duganella qianjiadongensis]
MIRLCLNSACARQLFSRLPYCPYCGTIQQTTTAARSDAVAPPAGGVDTPAAASTELASSGTRPVPRPGQSTAAQLAPPLAPQTPIEQPARAGARPLAAPARWLAAALVLLAAAIYLAAPAWPETGYVAVACDAPAASELTILLDLPAPLEPSTRAEVLVRLSRALDAEQSGVRRISVFSTRARHGDVATPVVSACAAPTMLGSLLGARGLAPQLKAQLLGKIESQLAVQDSAAALTQVVADLSVSQYLRAPQNTLLVFSDLIDKSARFNLFSCDNSQDVIHHYRASHAGAVERPAFRNTAVDLNAVPDPGISPATARCRKAFWQWYFSDAEGPGAQLAMNFLPGRLKKKN